MTMNNPAFYHDTVLLNEAVEGLSIVENGVYVDATFGGGGHSKAILSRLGQNGKLFTFDQDADAWRNFPDDERCIKIPENFRYIKKFLKLNGCPKVDGILADLGVSSYQFDTGARGFSIRFDGPLDMRMDQRCEKTAADVLMNYSEEQLHLIFEQYGEVRNSKQLAKQIVTNRKKGNINSIESFKALINGVVKGLPAKYYAQVFQAIRIEVNDELGALKDLLIQSSECLKPGGRLSVITFHSLEDRIVKQFIKNGDWNAEETDMMGNRKNVKLFSAINNKPIEPTEFELKKNPRSRSARLRIAEKI